VRLLMSLRWRGMLEATATGRESRVVIANTLAVWIIQTGVVAGLVALKDQRMMREPPRAATPTSGRVIFRTMTTCEASWAHCMQRENLTTGSS
jgi:hypothetical protein